MTICFEEAMKDAYEFAISPGCSTENKGFISEVRIDRSTVPEDWYVYDIRHSPTGAYICIEPEVVVNYAGSFLTKQELIFKKRVDGDQVHYLNGRGGYTFLY